LAVLSDMLVRGSVRKRAPSALTPRGDRTHLRTAAALPPRATRTPVPMTADRPGLLAELRRRKVFRVAAVYAGVGFLLVQVANNFVPALHLPPWTTTLVAMLVVLGFPVALVLAWALELTPDGLRRTPSADDAAAGFPIADGNRADVAGGGGGAHADGGRADGGGGANGGSGAGGAGGWTAQRIAAVGGVVVLAMAGGAFLITGGSRDRAVSSDAAPARSMAVLPFANLSAEAENEFLADGITEDIRGRLSRLGELRVISRTSAMTYKGTTRTAREIGQELGVVYLLEGTVQRSGDRLRVGVQLVDARTDETHWSDTFDRRVTDVFAIQAEIAERIAEALRIRLSDGERARLGRGQTTNLAAYELYLKGLDLLRQPATGPAEHRASRTTAVALLKQAVELDPDYALPHAALAWAYDELPDLPLAERRDSTRVLAERVIRMAPELPDGYAELGWYHVGFNNLEAASEQLRLALDRDPNHEAALAGMARHELFSGRPADAMRYQRRVLDVAPTDGWAYDGVAGIHAVVGDFEAAETWYRKAWLEVSDAPALGYCYLAHLARYRGDRPLARARLDTLHATASGEYGLECAASLELTLGDVAAAGELVARGARTITGDNVPRLLMAAVALHAGDRERADALLAEMESGVRTVWELCSGRCSNYDLARIRALQGRTDEAIQYVQRSIETGSDLWYPVAPDPYLASIQDDPRYQALLAERRAHMDRERARLAAASD
jgi:TolB-like protein